MYRYLYSWSAQEGVAVESLPLVPLMGSLVTGPEMDEEDFAYMWSTQFPDLDPPRWGTPFSHRGPDTQPLLLRLSRLRCVCD